MTFVTGFDQNKQSGTAGLQTGCTHMLCSVRCGSRPRVRSRLVRGPPLPPPPCTHLAMPKASSSASRYDSTLSSFCVIRGSWIVGLEKHSLACKLQSHTTILHQANVEMGRCHALHTTSVGVTKPAAMLQCTTAAKDAVA